MPIGPMSRSLRSRIAWTAVSRRAGARAGGTGDRRRRTGGPGGRWRTSRRRHVPLHGRHPRSVRTAPAHYERQQYTGSLVHPTGCSPPHIASPTAARRGLSVTVGRTVLSSNQGERFGVSEIVVHPGWSPSPGNYARGAAASGGHIAHHADPARRSPRPAIRGRWDGADGRRLGRHRSGPRIHPARPPSSGATAGRRIRALLWRHRPRLGLDLRRFGRGQRLQRRQRRSAVHDRRRWWLRPAGRSQLRPAGVRDAGSARRVRPTSTPPRSAAS